ncbi:MAG: cell division protein FtsZ [Sphingobacteriia bacterium]|nr:cell division protein FtsZ [Sphingobacteriia bacterium]
MSLNLNVPESIILKPKITVIGVGGAGGNAVNNMIKSHLEGADFVIANTDAQALENSEASTKIQLGEQTTRGLGAGASPDIGRASAEESAEFIEQILEGSNMVFITAGMGGGTGTGAAPVVAKIARSKGILTVGVVTKPFHFEGAHRMRLAEAGLKELQKYVDTLIVIPNQNLFRIANERTTFADAFKMADDVLHAGVRGVTDLITMPGLINLDFADIVTIMSKMGKAMMGTGEASGDNRAIQAAEAAISNPLLDHTSMKGARGVLINITGGPDMTLFEVDEAANRIRDEVDSDANIIFGSTFNPALEGKIRITVVATGIEAHTGFEDHQLQQAPVTQFTITATTQDFEKDHVSEHVINNINNIAKSTFETQIEKEVDEIILRSNEEIEETVEHLEEELISAGNGFVSQQNSRTEVHPFTTSQQQNYSGDNYQAQKRNIQTSEPSTRVAQNDKVSTNKGIFSRVASSIFGQQHSTDSRRSSSTNNHPAPTQEDVTINENDLEIPAFLRRKPKS